MPNPIASLSPVALPEIRGPRPDGTAGSSDFGTLLRDSIARVEGLRQDAGARVARLLAGEGEELHSAALAVQQAELAFELFVQVRNKIVQAYQEVMRMQV